MAHKHRRKLAHQRPIAHNDTETEHDGPTLSEVDDVDESDVVADDEAVVRARFMGGRKLLVWRLQIARICCSEKENFFF